VYSVLKIGYVGCLDTLRDCISSRYTIVLIVYVFNCVTTI